MQHIASLDELIDRLTVAVEGLEDAIEFELLLDGLSRLCGQRPDDLQNRLGPLVHRFRKVLPGTGPMVTSAFGLPMLLFKPVIAWFEPESPDRDMDPGGGEIIAFLNRRLGRLAERIRKRQSAPLLACPTHRQGWIEAGEFIQRLRWYEQHGQDVEPLDFQQGLLRLAPDGLCCVVKQSVCPVLFRERLGDPDTMLGNGIEAGRLPIPTRQPH